MNNSAFVKRDLNVLWHPCTQMKDHEALPLIPIKSGQGVWLEDFEGNRYLDAISSWWVNLFGHANPRINNAIKAQLDKLEHVILAGCSHEGAVTLAERLVALTPPGLSRCFYADNGSSAVEAALKMSFQYWQNIGQTKKIRFANLQNSYHGETLGALSVGDVDLYKETYAPLLLDVLTLPVPHSFDRLPSESSQAQVERVFAKADALLAKHADELAALIVEPLVQCAGNMRMYDAYYLKLLRKACDRYGIHLIADEIAVGFGRTGKLFACEHAAITPDFMCLSKGLTGGYLPLSVVLTTETIYEAFYDDYASLKAFLHSHSYTGNPLAISAALATLDIFENDHVIKNNETLIVQLKQALAPFHDHPHIGEVRQQGFIAALEMVDKNGQPFPWQERRGMRVYQHGLKNGMLLRPLAHVVYFMPPYVITPDEIAQMVHVAGVGIEEATKL